MDSFRLIFKDAALRRKILFILGALAVFRVGAAIPIPGVDAGRLASFFSGNQFFGLLNVFTGGALDNLSILMLGVGPYITASIIMQLMTMIIPSLKEMYQHEGEAGQAKFNQYSRYLTVPLAVVQGFALLALLGQQGVLGELTPFAKISNILIVTAGSLLLMWIGELITEYGIGNGVSILIFTGIVARIPQAIQQTLFSFDPSQIPVILGFLVAAAVVVAGVVVVTEGQRPVPISYARRVRGNRVYGGVSTYLPLRVNQAGVIPIIFALSILLFPQMIVKFLTAAPNAAVQAVAGTILGFLANPWVDATLYFILVFAFTYFYTSVTFDPGAISENLQKSGAFIPGIRPGSSTAEFLYKILSRITLVGALFLGVIAVLPLIMRAVTGFVSLTIGGTALLIVVSVVLETIKQIQAQIVMRSYE